MPATHIFARKGVVCGACPRDVGRFVTLRPKEATCRKCLNYFAAFLGFAALMKGST